MERWYGSGVRCQVWLDRTVGWTIRQAAGPFQLTRRTGIQNPSLVGPPKWSGGPPGDLTPGPVAAEHFAETHECRTTHNLDSKTCHYKL
jgi:hypothetical protein